MPLVPPNSSTTTARWTRRRWNSRSSMSMRIVSGDERHLAGDLLQEVGPCRGRVVAHVAAGDHRVCANPRSRSACHWFSSPATDICISVSCQKRSFMCTTPTTWSTSPSTSGVAAVRGRLGNREVCPQRLAQVERRHLRARHHDLAHDRVRHLEDVFEQHAFLRADHAHRLGRRHQHAQTPPPSARGRSRRRVRCPPVSGTSWRCC